MYLFTCALGLNMRTEYVASFPYRVDLVAGKLEV